MELDFSVPIYGRACYRTIARFSASTISIPGAGVNVASLMSNPAFELLRHDVTFPLYVEVDDIAKPGGMNLRSLAFPLGISGFRAARRYRQKAA